MGSLNWNVVSHVLCHNSRNHRRTLVRLFVGAAGVIVIESGASRQVGCAMFVVIAGVVGEAFIADLAALNMAKNPITTRNKVAAGLLARRVEAGAVTD